MNGAICTVNPFLPRWVFDPRNWIGINRLGQLMLWTPPEAFESQPSNSRNALLISVVTTWHWRHQFEGSMRSKEFNLSGTWIPQWAFLFRAVFLVFPMRASSATDFRTKTSGTVGMVTLSVACFLTIRPSLEIWDVILNFREGSTSCNWLYHHMADRRMPRSTSLESDHVCSHIANLRRLDSNSQWLILREWDQGNSEKWRLRVDT